MNKRIITGFFTLTLFAPSFVFAIYHNTTEKREKAVQNKEATKSEVKDQNEVKGQRKELRSNVAERRDGAIEKKNNEVRTIEKEQVKTLRADVAEKREMLKTEIKEKQDTLKTDIKQRRDGIKMEAKNLSPEILKEKRTMLRDDVKKERTELKKQIKEKRETFRDEAKERVDALKKKISEEKAKRVEVFFGTMVRKFEAAVSRLRDLSDRIDSRLDKFDDSEKDTTELRASLDKAKLVIDETESTLDRAKAEFGVLTQSENLQEYFKKVKEIISNVEKKVKDAHKALVDVINSTKGASTI